MNPMHTSTFLTALGLSCAWLAGCSGHNVDLDRADAAATDTSGRIDAVILQHANDPIASRLVVDDARLYWSTWGGNVQSCLKTECANTVLTYASKASTAEPATSPRVSASAGRVFWRSTAPNDTIFACPTAGCANSPTKIFRDSKAVHGLTSDADYAYWASDIDLYRCKSSGCGPTPELVALGQVQSPVVSGQNAYWLTFEAGGGSIQSAPKDGAAPASVLLPAEADAMSFTVNGDTLFWQNRDYQILSCTLPDCSGDPTLVIDNTASYKNDLTADDTRVYWRTDKNLVQSCELSGCTEPMTVSTDQAQSFTVDSDFIYWADLDARYPYVGLNVHRLAKSAL